MGVTNGFLRLSRAEFKILEQDAAAFEERCLVQEEPDYLDMDKAGYELEYIVDPASVEFDNPKARSTVPAIADVLGGGVAIHPDVDFSYGPARLVSDESMQRSLPEFARLTFNELYAMASTEQVSELLMCETDEATIRDYHWVYLQELATFVREALARDMVVLRY